MSAGGPDFESLRDELLEAMVAAGATHEEAAKAVGKLRRALDWALDKDNAAMFAPWIRPYAKQVREVRDTGKAFLDALERLSPPPKLRVAESLRRTSPGPSRADCLEAIGALERDVIDLLKATDSVSSRETVTIGRKRGSLERGLVEWAAIIWHQATGKWPPRTERDGPRGKENTTPLYRVVRIACKTSPSTYRRWINQMMKNETSKASV